MKKKELRTIILSLLFLVVPVISNAAVVYDNFGPNNEFNNGASYSISPAAIQGIQFTPSASGLLTSIDLPLSSATSSQDARFDLYTDSADSLGTLLESLNITNLNTGITPTIRTAFATGTTSLVGGQKYWLIANSLSTFDVFWHFNSTGDAGLRWINGNITNARLATLRVNTNAVPIPASIWLFGSGLAGLIGLARRKKF